MSILTLTERVSIPQWFDYNYLMVSGYQDFQRLSQFHNGSITTFWDLQKLTKLQVESQFHNGSITTYPFNITEAIEFMSQFHNGSITTSNQWKIYKGNWTSLNSTMVRLQQKMKNSLISFCEDVSIPQWFDYNSRVIIKVFIVFLISLNSTMVRLQHMKRP